MTKFERLLVPGSTELPDCQCAAEMRLARATQIEKPSGTEVRTYECIDCGHELRLMVWADGADPVAAVGGL
jgi:hypothetical protein